MTIFGILLLLAGGGAAIYGYQMNNSLEAQLNSFFSSGTTNPGTSWIIIGAVVAVIGLVMLIAGVTKKNK